MECDICGEPIEPGQKFFAHEEDEDGPETLVHDVCPEVKPVLSMNALHDLEVILFGEN